MNNTLKTIIFGFAIFTSFSVLADDDYLYIGFGLSAGSSTLESETSGNTYESDMDHDQTEFKIGYQFSSQKRIEISITNIDLEREDDNFKSEYSGFDVDWHFPFEAESIQPFVGVGFGLYEYEDTGHLFFNDEDLEGVAINLMAGIFIPVTEKVEIELAYKHKTIAWQSVVVETSKVDLTTSLNSLALSAKVKF